MADSGKQLAINLPPIHKMSEQISNIVWICGTLHDYAKATTAFQNKLRKKEFTPKEARHSHLSAIVTFENVWRFLDLHDGQIPDSRLPLLAYLAVKRHHGNLSSALDDLSISNSDIDLFKTQLNQVDTSFIDDLTQILKPLVPDLLVNPQQIVENLEDIIHRIRSYKRAIRRNKTGIKDMVELSQLFSLLIDADKLDASETRLGSRDELPSDFIANHIENLGSPTTEINTLRTQAFHEALSFADSLDLSQKIMSLTLPTGLGKTYSVIALAQRLRDKIARKEKFTPRIVYCLPFTSVIDQNFEDLFTILNKPVSSILLRHHHMGDTIYSTPQDDEEYDYNKSSLLIEGWNSEIIVTTFVQLVSTLAGFKNRNLRRAHNLSGAIVILDEVQAIPYRYWHLVDELARINSDVLGTRFILVTATQPKIFGQIPEVIKEPDRYFQEMSRINFDVNLHPIPFNEFKESTLQSLSSELAHDHLIILNTKRAAEEMYSVLYQEGFEEELTFLSSSVIPLERSSRIKALREKKNKNRIAISTQIVEAGVDIDFHIVTRDFAPLDSIIQAAGRCNRNMSANKGHFSIRHLIDDRYENSRRTFSSYIYDPTLLDATKFILEENPLIDDAQLQKVTSLYFDEVKRRGSEKVSRDILKDVKKLDLSAFQGVKLIEDKGFLMKDIFVEYDQNATEVLVKYREIVESSLPRFVKKVKFLEIRRDLMKYIISVYTKDVGAMPSIDSLLYIPFSDLDRRYNSDTGFKPAGENPIIF